MRVNKIQNNNQTSFGIKISKGLYEAADRLYCGGVTKNQKAYNEFHRKAKYMEEHYGFNNYTITLQKQRVKGSRYEYYCLYAVKDDGSKVILRDKDYLRKIIEWFKHQGEKVYADKISNAEKYGA